MSGEAEVRRKLFIDIRETGYARLGYAGRVTGVSIGEREIGLQAVSGSTMAGTPNSRKFA